MRPYKQVLTPCLVSFGLKHWRSHPHFSAEASHSDGVSTERFLLQDIISATCPTLCTTESRMCVYIVVDAQDQSPNDRLLYIVSLSTSSPPSSIIYFSACLRFNPVLGNIHIPKKPIFSFREKETVRQGRLKHPITLSFAHTVSKSIET